MRFVENFEVRVPPGQALDYISDFANLAQWDASVTDVRFAPDQVFGVGAKYEVDLVFAGRPQTMNYHVRQYVAGEYAELVGTNEGSTAIDRITVKEHPNGARVTYEADIKIHGPFRFLDPLLALLFAPTVKKAVRAMRDNLNAKG
ncbi:MAG: SRPBCC family protein [Litorivicinus sp.]